MPEVCQTRSPATGRSPMAHNLCNGLLPSTNTQLSDCSSIRRNLCDRQRQISQKRTSGPLLFGSLARRGAYTPVTMSHARDVPTRATSGLRATRQLAENRLRGQLPQQDLPNTVMDQNETSGDSPPRRRNALMRSSVRLRITSELLAIRAQFRATSPIDGREVPSRG